MTAGLLFFEKNQLLLDIGYNRLEMQQKSFI